MFENPRYIRNSFSITFSRQKMIRRKANEFEDKLKGIYYPPQVIPIPDELDPEVPRLIFSSKHGFSQIAISQININLNVLYSPDWQIDPIKGKKYLIERVPILFELLKIMGDIKTYFCGLVTVIHIPCNKSDKELLEMIGNKYLKTIGDTSNIHELTIKKVDILDDKFFSNIHVQNYRIWDETEFTPDIPRLSIKNAKERGIKIIGDFNDRYAFNEDTHYFTDQSIIKMIIDRGFTEIEKEVNYIVGG